ncbi:unnamed protein product [Symbiodinium sp. KB8]|nr:unnamed protein product [Symbiodinium sp. KB8]
MSLVQLSRFVRRARNLAQLDLETQYAVFQAIPRQELRRIQEILEEDRHSDDSEASFQEDWQDPGVGASVPSVPTGDLIGLDADGAGPDLSAAACRAGSSTDSPEAALFDPVPVGSAEAPSDTAATSAAGGLLPAVSADTSAVQSLGGTTAAPDSGSSPVPAGLDDNESDGEIQPLPEWDWGESSVSPAPLVQEPLDLNAMDDFTVAVSPDLTASDSAGLSDPGADNNVQPVPLPTVDTAPVPEAASSSEVPTGGAGGMDGGTGGASVVEPAQPAVPAVQTGATVAQAPPPPAPVCRLELSGSAELPYLCAVDVLSGLALPDHVLPLRFPLQRLPKVLRDHGHSLSGYCTAPCRARCGYACGRPVSNTSRRGHSGHYCAVVTVLGHSELVLCRFGPLERLVLRLVVTAYLTLQICLSGLCLAVGALVPVLVHSLWQSLGRVVLVYCLSAWALLARLALLLLPLGRQYGLTQPMLSSLSAAGIKSYSSLLFAVASAPGAVDENRLKATQQKHLGDNPSEGTLSAFARLLFEAGTFVVAELRSSVAGDDDGTRKLTHQERSSSNALIDLAFSMVADGAVKYLAPSRCSSREAEVVSDKKDETLFRLEAASFKAARKPPNIKADVSSDLRLYQAFSRRGVALEVANLCSFAAHESYVRGLFEHLQRMAPPGYTAPGIDAVISADRAVWQQVATLVPCLPAVDVVATVDAALSAAAASPSVAFHVLPREKKRAVEDPAKPPPKFAHKGDSKGKDGKGKTGKGEEKGRKGKSPTRRGSQSGPSGKQTAVPAALKGLDPNRDGTPLCFDCNLAHGCKRETWQTAKGLQCERGAGFHTVAVDVKDVSGHVHKAWGRLPDGTWSTKAEAAYPLHPAEVDPELPSDLEYVVNCVESLSCGELASLRCQFLHSLLQRAQELSTLERQLHAGLAPHCRSVLKGKRLLLLGELLTGLGHADVHLVADVCSGFRLTGWLRASRVMEPKLTAPTESADNLWRRRVDLNSKAWAQTTSTGDPHLDEELWQATVKDAESGWARLLPASSAPPSEVLLSRRFAVVQGDRVRAVDDFSFSGVNDTLGTSEKVTTMSTVHTTALGLRLLRFAKAKGLTVLGRCFDLKSAYRQLPIHLQDLPFAAVAVWSPSDKAVRVLQMFALPFGAGDCWYLPPCFSTTSPVWSWLLTLTVLKRLCTFCFAS